MRVPRPFPSARNGRISSWAVSIAVALVLVVVSSSSAPIRAQGLSGINGTVTDASGGAVAGARVTARNDATGIASRAVTSSAGTYTITDLIPGVYTVKVEASGFATSEQRNVHVDVSRVSNADVTLTTGTVTD